MANIPEDATILVKYVRNTEGVRATEAITFPDDDRDQLPIGGYGYVTEHEFAVLTNAGLTLVVTDLDDAEEDGYVAPVADDVDPDALPDNLEELRQVAKDEGVDLEGKRSKRDVREAILESRSAQPEGRESLPPSVTRGQGATVTPGAPTAGSGTGEAGGTAT